MSSGPMRVLIHGLRRTALLPDGGGLTDGALLARFIDGRDEAAFEALVRRHGPMVLGVCRRVIGNEHDAEDAFQATFLVLVRKAAAVRPRELVGHWLYGVAYRTALEARGRIARRRAKEQPVHDLPQPEAEPDSPWQELRPLLDRELARLPDRYRQPVVLCDLEGRSRKEVARLLQVPEGTLSSRLARGRRLLARRLSRHGLLLAAGAVAGLLAKHGASAAVPSSLVRSTTRAGMVLAAGQSLATGGATAPAAALMEGVLRTMLLLKLKNVLSALLLAGLLGLAAVGLTGRAGTADPAGQPDRDPPAKDGLPESQAALRKQLQSLEWAVTRVDPKQATITVDQSVPVPNYMVGGWNNVTPPAALQLQGLALAKDVKVIVHGKEGKLSDLEPSTIVSLRFAPDRLAVRRITVVPSSYGYVVKAIDARKRTLTVSRGKATAATLEDLPLAGSVQVTKNGQNARLADVKVGTPVSLQLSADRDRLVVSGIWAGAVNTITVPPHLQPYVPPNKIPK